MRSLARGVVVGAAFGWALVFAGSAAADTLEARCKEVDRTRQADCEMQRQPGSEWVLDTSVQVGTGRKAAVEALEEQFCLAARQAGVSARVLHRSELPGAFGQGARMEWRCGLPAVSAAPRGH